jgi:type I restriction enzyme, S subunit
MFIERGDVIFSRNASFGVACRVESDVEFAIGQDVIIMAPKYYALGYIFYCLQSDSIFQQISAVSSGSTFGRINLSEIRKLQLPVPEEKERDLISAHLDACSQLRIQFQDELASLKRLKSALMQDILTGRVSVAPLLESVPA